jgi:hypothetical protein
MAIVGGVALGIAVGTGVVLAGVFDQPPTTAAVALYRCPQPGTPILTVPAGQTLLVTARSADAAWLQVHVAEPAIQRAWVTAGDVRVQGDPRTLPVASCTSPGRGTPTGSTILISVAQPTPAATPTVTPSITPSPSVSTAVTDTITLTDLRANPSPLNTGDRATCPTGRATTISVNATSNTSIASVTLLFRRPGETTDQPRPMTQQAGTGTWTAVLNADLDVINDGPVAYHVVAVTASQNPVQALLPETGDLELDVHVCAAPTEIALNDLRADPDPLNGGDATTCPDGRTTTISVEATSAGPITRVTLHFRRPGDSAEQNRSMLQRAGTTTWTAVLDADRDKLIAGPVQYRVDAVGGTDGSVRAASPANGRTVPLEVHVCPPPATIRLANLRASPNPFNGGDRTVCPTARSTTISVTATANAPFQSVTLLFRRPSDGADVPRTMTQRPGTTTWTYSLTADGDRVTAGPVRYRVRAITAGEGTSTAFLPARGFQSVDLKVCPPDTEGPTLGGVKVSPPAVSLCAPRPVTVTINATDPVGVETVTLIGGNVKLGQRPMAPTSNPNVWSVQIPIDASWPTGTFTFRFVAFDKLDHRSAFPPAGTALPSFTVTQCDRTPPRITAVTTSTRFIRDSECGPTTVTINATVTDDTAVDTVRLVLTDSTGKSSAALPFTHTAGDAWTIKVDRDGWAYGTLRFVITATDTADHTATASGSVEVQPCPDVKGPTLSTQQSSSFVIQPPCTPTSVTFTADATDPSGVDRVVFTLGDSNSPILRQAMTRNGSTFTLVFTARTTSPVGKFGWLIEAFDSLGNRTSDTGALEIRDCPDTEPPNITDTTQSSPVLYQSGCTPSSVKFSVFATDNVGVDRAVFILGDRSSPLLVRTMTQSGSNSWTTTITKDSSWSDGEVLWFIDVYDAADNHDTAPGELQLDTCSIILSKDLLARNAAPDDPVRDHRLRWQST